MSKPGDPRLGSIIQPGADGDIVIVGFPFDEGTVRNGGRAGSCNSPDVFRTFLYKMGCLHNMEYGVDLSSLRISDAGNISAPAAPAAGPAIVSLEEAHEALHKTVRDLLAAGKIVFVIGGSNDQSSSNGRALLDVLDEEAAVKKGGDDKKKKKKKSKMFCVNIDAHFDVRPRMPSSPSSSSSPSGLLIHSGCPFRDLLEDGRLDGRNFVEFAAQGSQCSAEHYNYVTKEKGGSVVWLSQLARAKEEDSKMNAGRIFEQVIDTVMKNAKKKSDKNETTSNDDDDDGDDALFVSFDIDSVSGADCPGVSCPSTVGLSAQDAIDICIAAGRNEKTRLFDLSELNVAIEGYRSPRLAVNMFYFFLIGVAQRGRK